MHRLVLWTLFVVVVGMVGNGLPGDVRVGGREASGRRRAMMRAVCLFGVEMGSCWVLHGVDGVVGARLALAGGAVVVADRRQAAGRAWGRGSGYVGRARVGDDGVVGAALAAALAAALGARDMVVGVLFAVLVANVDDDNGGVVVVVQGGRGRGRKLGFHGRVRLATGALGSNDGYRVV